MSSSLLTSPLLLEAVSQPLRSRDQGKPWKRGRRQVCGLGRCHTMFSSENREEALRRRGGGGSWLTDRGGRAEGVNASQGARSIVMSCEAPAHERDCELERFLVFLQFKDFHLFQRATEGGSIQRKGLRKFLLEGTNPARCL